MDTFLQRSPRNLGTLRSSGLDRQRFTSGPRLDATPMNEPAVSSYTPRPAAAPRPQPVVARARPDLSSLDQYQPGSFGAINQAANLGVYRPGSVGDINARANGTDYRPSPGTSDTGIVAPAQTERANPLSGTNNIPRESTTTSVPPPFIQRGSAIPRGQDAAPVKTTETIDSDIASSMRGTFNNLRGTAPQSPIYRPSFQRPAEDAYTSYRRRIFG